MDCAIHTAASLLLARARFQAAMQQQAAAAQDGKDGAAGPARPDVAMVSPTPGVCIKSFNDKEEKVFINICHSDLVRAGWSAAPLFDVAGCASARRSLRCVPVPVSARRPAGRPARPPACLSPPLPLCLAVSRSVLSSPPWRLANRLPPALVTALRWR